MHQIKKYANRKLYDTTDKRYLSMDKLSELIKSGAEVKITDNESGEDITGAVVSKLLAMEKESGSGAVPSSVLIGLLRRGRGTISDYTKKYTSLWQSALTMAEDEMDKTVGKLIKSKDLSEDEGRTIKKDFIGFADSLKTWIGERIDKRVSEVSKAMNLASREQVEHLTASVERLSDKLDELEKRCRESDQNARR